MRLLPTRRERTSARAPLSTSTRSGSARATQSRTSSSIRSRGSSTAAEWAELERGLAQRARALNALLADSYGERRIVTEGVIPDRVLNGAEYLEPEMEGLAGERPATVIGFDLVRGQDGKFVVLEDNSRTPSGMAYATAARGVSEVLFPDAADKALPLDPVFEWLSEAVRGAAPDGVEDPVCVLLSDGPANSAWYEHVVVAERIGVPVVQPGDVESSE